MLTRILWQLATRLLGAHKITPDMITALQHSIEEEAAQYLAAETRP